MGRVTLLRLARGAVLRDNELRERAGTYWDTSRRAGKVVRMDEGVKLGASSRGLGYICSDDEEDDDAESVTVDGDDGKEENPLGYATREAVGTLMKVGLTPPS